MKTIKVLFSLMMVLAASSAFAQSKGEMPFTTSSPDGNKLLRHAWVALADAKLDESEKLRHELLNEDPDCGIAYISISSPTGEELKENVKIAETKNLSPDERMLIKGLRARLEDNSTQEYFDPLISKYPSDYYLHLLIMLYNSDTERAIEIGENIMKRKPKFAPTFNLLGYLYMDKNEMAKAESFFDKYLSLRPDLANPYDSKGDYFMRIGKIEEAIPLYEKAVALGMSASAAKAESAKLQLKFPKPSEGDKSTIAALIPATIDAYEKGDANELLKDYSEYALKIWGHNTTTAGLSGIRRIWTDSFKNRKYSKFDGSTGLIYGTGPIAITYGTIESTEQYSGSGDQQQRKQNVIYFLEKESDGKWRILLDHFYDAHGDNPELSAEDRQQIARLINSWDKALPSGEVIEDKHLENMGSLYSVQAVEIFPNQTSNIGIGNIRARWEAAKGASWEINKLSPLGIEGLGDRAIAWGIATQKVYAKDSKESSTHQFPWAMMVTKEKDQSWKILVLHWSRGG